MPTRPADPAHAASTPEDDGARALRLIGTQRTLVLATADPEPWAAPVYYAYRDGRFWFLSSPASRHVTASLATGRCAGSVFRDADDWRDIEGVQMDGTVAEGAAGEEAEAVFAAYVRRFPTVATLLADGPVDLARLTSRLRVRLYAFVPRSVHYVGNRAGGLGGRRAVRLPG